MKKPIAIYALHTLPPMSRSFQEQRNFELSVLALYAQPSPDIHVIAEGDWNITPYSPWFRDLLKKTDLNYQSYGLFLDPTWPSFMPLAMLRIPIDQILFSNGLIQTGKYVGPSTGSDHHALIAGFSEK